MKPSKTGYFASLSLELSSQAKRVRQLIGDAHWGHDGRHKELLLMELIRRHCPPTVLVSTGFVVSPTDMEMRSSEQDILIVDASKEAPLFHQGALVVVFAHTVFASISVKTKLDSETLRDTVNGLRSVREVARDGGINAEKIWCGGFFYETQEPWMKNSQLIYDNAKRAVIENPARPPILNDDQPHIIGPNCICDAEDFAVMFDYSRSENTNAAKMRGFSCSGMATAIFVSSILQHVALSLGAAHSPFADMVDSLGVAAFTPSTFDITG